MIYKTIIEAMSADELKNYVAMQDDLELAMNEALMAKDDLIEVLSHLFDVERREQDARRRLIGARQSQLHMDEMMIRSHQDAFCATAIGSPIKQQEAQGNGEQ